MLSKFKNLYELLNDEIEYAKRCKERGALHHEVG